MIRKGVCDCDWIVYVMHGGVWRRGKGVCDGEGRV